MILNRIAGGRMNYVETSENKVASFLQRQNEQSMLKGTIAGEERSTG